VNREESSNNINLRAALYRLPIRNGTGFVEAVLATSVCQKFLNWRDTERRQRKGLSKSNRPAHHGLASEAAAPWYRHLSPSTIICTESDCPRSSVAAMVYVPGTGDQ
jgi:hypothetical protein